MAEYIIVAAIAVLLWIPILIRFFRNWTQRKNPVSLAICLIILLVIWELAARIWVLKNKLSDRQMLYAFSVLEAVVALNFHIAFRWSVRRFPDSRHK